MRTADFDQTALQALSGPVTRPIFLIDLYFDEELYLSTNGDHTVDSIDYAGEAVNLRAVADWSQATLQIRATPQRAAIVDTPDWRNKPCRIAMITVMEYYQYWANDYAVPDYGVQGTLRSAPYVLLNGLLTGASLEGQYINLEVSHIAMQRRWSPRRRVAPPEFNFLPAPGSVTPWNGTLYTFDARMEI